MKVQFLGRRVCDGVVYEGTMNVNEKELAPFVEGEDYTTSDKATKAQKPASDKAIKHADNK